MPKYPVDLGQKGPLCAPCNPCCGAEEPSVHYPSLYLEGVDLDLPLEGTMTIKFRRLRDSELTPRKGEAKHECCIEVTSVESVKGEKSEEDSGEVLDRLRKKAEKKEDEDEDY